MPQQHQLAIGISVRLHGFYAHDVFQRRGQQAAVAPMGQQYVHGALDHVDAHLVWTGQAAC